MIIIYYYIVTFLILSFICTKKAIRIGDILGTDDAEIIEVEDDKEDNKDTKDKMDTG